MIEIDTYVVIGIQSSGQGNKIFTTDGRQVFQENENIKIMT